MSKFSKVLSELMLKNDISDSDLAEKVDVNRTTVNRWRTGERSPKLEKLPEIANIFGVPATMFVDAPISLVSKVNENMQRLDKPHQQNVYNYTEDQLKDQLDDQLTETDEPYLQAAHIDNDATDEERNGIDDFIDSLDPDDNSEDK